MTFEELANNMVEDAVVNFHRIFDIFVDYYSEERVDLNYNKKAILNSILDARDKTLEVIRDRAYGANNISGSIYRQLLYEHMTPSFRSCTLGELLAQNEVALVKNAILLWVDTLKAYAIILVHWPRVTVTNERGGSVDIMDLYARIHINIDGKLRERFKLNRSTFPIDQWCSGYLHSHVSVMHKGIVPSFAIPCVGDGPIGGTIRRIGTTEFDHNRWSLFCYELDKYVRVESLSGGPYIHISDIGKSERFIRTATDAAAHTLYNAQDKKFVGYVLENLDLQYGYCHGQYHIAMSFARFALSVSNLYIEYINASGQAPHRELDRYIISGDCIYKEDSIAILTIPDLQDCTMFYFKGKPVTLKILNVPSQGVDADTYKLLSLAYLGDLYIKITRIVNLVYGKGENAPISAN